MEDSKDSRFRFHGNLTIPNEKPSEFSATIHFPKWDPTVLTVDLLWLGNRDEKMRGAFALNHLGRDSVCLNSLDPRQGPAELLHINKVDTGPIGSPHNSSIGVTAVQIGITKDRCEKAQVYQTMVRLQPSGILGLPSITTRSSTGEVVVEKIESGKVELQLNNAVFEAKETFEYYETQQNGNSITHRVRGASLIGKVTLDGGKSLFDVHESLKRELNDVCAALSLCYRQPVDYYEIEYISMSDNDLPWRPIYRRKLSSVKAKTSDEELINIRALVDGGLQNLLVLIRESPHAVDVRRALNFIAASYTTTTEVAFFMVFSAMETVLSCCLEHSEELLLSASRWKKIESALRKTIEDQIQDDAEARTGLRDKLPELRRPTLSRKVSKACQRYHPKTEDIWPKISFEEGMKRAIGKRNGLFHAAEATMEDAIGKDLLRVRTFTERLLLKFLVWPDEAIWTWYDQDLKWANQGSS